MGVRNVSELSFVRLPETKQTTLEAIEINKSLATYTALSKQKESNKQSKISTLATKQNDEGIEKDLLLH